MTLIRAKSDIMGFVAKLDLYRSSLSRRDFSHFPSLVLLSVADDELLVFVEHLASLKEDMLIRFSDLRELYIPNWSLNPFFLDLNEVMMNAVEYQEELLEIKEDTEAQICFQTQGCVAMWTHFQTRYPNCWNIVRVPMTAFLTSYLVEAGFSQLFYLLSKQRNCLDVEKRGDLRLKLMNSIKPQVDKLAHTHQPQGSH